MFCIFSFWKSHLICVVPSHSISDNLRVPYFWTYAACWVIASICLSVHSFFFLYLCIGCCLTWLLTLLFQLYVSFEEVFFFQICLILLIILSFNFLFLNVLISYSVSDNSKICSLYRSGSCIILFLWTLVHIDFLLWSHCSWICLYLWEYPEAWVKSTSLESALESICQMPKGTSNPRPIETKFLVWGIWGHTDSVNSSHKPMDL